MTLDPMDGRHPRSTSHEGLVHVTAIAELRRIPLGRLVALRRNPQYLTPHQMDALVASVQRDGFLVPILIRPLPKGKAAKASYAAIQGKYEIISGNHRAMAAKRAGLKHVPAVVKRLTDAQAQLVAINLNTIHGEPNSESMAPFLAELDDETLKSIHLEQSLLDQMKAFDATLEARLRDLSTPPPALDWDSPTNALPSCVCQACGRRHVPKEEGDA